LKLLQPDFPLLDVALDPQCDPWSPGERNFPNTEVYIQYIANCRIIYYYPYSNPKIVAHGP